MILPYRATAEAQHFTATAAAGEARAAWKQQGLERVEDADVAAANASLEQLKLQLRDLDNPVFHERVSLSRLLSLRQLVLRALGLDSLEWYLGAPLFATAPCALAAIVLAFLQVSLPLAFLLLGVVFLASATYVALIWRRLDRSEFSGKAQELSRWVQERRAAIEHTRIYQPDAEARLKKALLLRELRRRYEEAVAEVARLEGLLANRRYQLARHDWRSLRGVPFENFLAEVFQELGYTVQTTKTSGDQGVDLILTGNGGRIAVHAKGYDGSVGNSAVQEVFAGMKFYQCDRCLVVTNSVFTGPARQLANSLGCLLVDGQQVPRLIHGHVL